MRPSPILEPSQNSNYVPASLATLRAQVSEQLTRILTQDGILETPIQQLRLGRVSRTVQPIHTVYEPALCIIAQGRKRILLGEEVYVYGPSQYLVFAQNLPVSGEVIHATLDQPHLAIRLDLNIEEILSLSMELGMDEEGASRRIARGIYTGELSVDLLDPMLRLIRLLDTPQDLPVLAPLIIREIHYRLLRSPDGWRLAQMARGGTHSSRIAQVIEILRSRFNQTLRMADVAEEVHMSTSALHHSFKAITAMSPVQYQKQLRLLEARRMMLAEEIDAATVGYRVGYISQSQFSREYSRFFGMPPIRDVKHVKTAQRINAQ